MLTLTLFRHAKSSWSHPGLGDFDRPLSERGEEAVPKMAAYLAEQGLVPDLVLCSSARRTRETLGLALPCWRTKPKIDYVKALYLADVPALLAATRDAPPDVRHLMIVGHNPGLQNFALKLIGSKAKGAGAISRKFPTAAIATITFDTDDWQAIELGAGHLHAFVTPKQFEAD